MKLRATFLFIIHFFLVTYIGAQAVKKIEIVHSDIVSVNEIIRPDVQVLLGGVILKHDSALMYCDSAYYDAKQNNFKAFGKIHVLSPTEDMMDTVHLWGESLDYIGKEKMAVVKKNVILKKDSMMLYTNDLDYNIESDIGTYYNGGRTINGEDTLLSKRGYYYANEDELFFKENVVIYNPKYTIYSDTLKHNTKRKISFILGPTNIVSTDTAGSFLYCENGLYNHTKDNAQFNKNAYLVHEKKTLKGDSLYYDRKLRIGKAFNNVRIIDSTQNAILTGDFGQYNEESESSLFTRKAVFIQIQKDDSLFLHADTLLSLKDTVYSKTDTSSISIIKGFHKVKIFKSDFQAKCDSLLYTTLDSTITLFSRPVLWSGKNQITAKLVKVFTKNNEINLVEMTDNSMIVSQSDTINFDQIRGKNMIAYIIDDKLTKIDVNEEGAAIYFGKEGEKLIGVNKITCADMKIYMDSNQVDRIWFYGEPDGTLYPPDYLSESELKFDTFVWHEKHRPKKKDDIFIWVMDEQGSELNAENKTDKSKKDNTKGRISEELNQKDKKFNLKDKIPN